MKNERLNGDNGCKTFVIADTLLEKYNGNDENLRLPGFIYTVGNRAFAGNDVIKTVSLSSNTVEIFENAFDGCKSLETISLPYDLKTIGKKAFNGCSSLKLIVFNGTKERWFAVKKGNKWLGGTPGLIISCKDGNITKQAELEIDSEPRADFNFDECQTEDNTAEGFAFEERGKYLEQRRREIIIETEDDEDDDKELDRKFAEYERFLSEQLSCFDDEDKDEQVCVASKLLDKMSKKNAAKDLANVLFKIAEKKQDEITTDCVPSHSMWSDEEQFNNAVMARLEKLMRSNLKMAKHGAIKKAETYLEAVRDTRDRAMMQVYERLIYELKMTSDKLYNEIRKYMRSGH